MPEPAPIQYIRWEGHPRFHAVYFSSSLVVTYCGRFAQESEVKVWSYSPSAVCHCCRSRMEKPWLIPQPLKAAKEKKWTKKTCQDSAASALKH